MIRSIKEKKIFSKIKKYGPIAVFMFFFIKGLLWLIIPLIGYYFLNSSS